VAETVITVSPSEILTARQCPLKHQLTYEDRWTKAQTESSNLGLGTLWHSVIEAHRRALFAGDDLMKAIDAAFDVLDGIQSEEAKELISWMYTGYTQFWGDDSDLEVIDIEMAFEVDLPRPKGWPAGEVEFRLKGKIDLFYRYKRRVWVLDEKSCKDLPKKLDLDFDDQFGLYYWAATQLGYPVFGAMHSASRKVRLKTRDAPLHERFSRTPIHKNQAELDKIAEEAWQTAYDTYTRLHRLREMARHGVRLDAPRHTDPRQCAWKCDWTEECILGRKGADLRGLIRAKGFRQDHSRH
jgi:hypothetical protein